MTATGRRGSRRVVWAALIAAGLLGAASTVAASGPGQPVFGIRPVLLGHTTLRDHHFTYALPAGSTVADAVVLNNFTPSALTLTVYPADLLQARGGALAPAQPGPQHGVGAWLRVARGSVTVPGFGHRIDPFRLVVPRGTPPGQYLGAVVASRIAGVTASGLAVETRAALIVEVTVPGRVRVALRVSRPRASRRGSAEVFSTTVSNHGTVLVTLSQATLTVRHDGRTTTLPLRPAGLYVVPDGKATLSAVYRPLPWFGTLRITAAADATVNGHGTRRYHSPALVLRFIPWQAVGWAGAGLAALGLGALLGRHGLARWWANRREERRVVSELRRRRRGDARRSGRKRP